MPSWTRLGPWVDPQESKGVSLAGTMINRLRSSELSVPVGTAVPEGPHFVYQAAPTLFSNRRGRGPLHIAWDTNLLIDYFEHGPNLWTGAPLSGEVPNKQYEELEGLQLLMALWVVRDIRFHVPKFFLHDSKRKPLSPERHAQRQHAMMQFLRAIALVADADGVSPKPRDSHRTDDHILRRVPAGNDRVLVEESLRAGVDVFLTRDAGILRSRAAIRMLGLMVASPLDVVEELAAAGALHCLLDPAYLTWPMPDQQRVAHLIAVLTSSCVPRV